MLEMQTKLEILKPYYKTIYDRYKHKNRSSSRSSSDDEVYEKHKLLQTTSSKNPKQNSRGKDDPQQKGIGRRFGRENTPLFDRAGLKAKKSSNSRETYSSRDEKIERKRTASPKARQHQQSELSRQSSSSNHKPHGSTLNNDTPSTSTSLNQNSRIKERRSYDRGKKRSASPQAYRRSESRRISSSPDHRYESSTKHKLNHDMPSTSTRINYNRRSKERRSFDRGKRKRSSLSKSPVKECGKQAKQPYYLDPKREEDRIRQKYRSRENRNRENRESSRENRDRSIQRNHPVRSETRDNSRLGNVQPEPLYYPPQYIVVHRYIPPDPMWRPPPPYPIYNFPCHPAPIPYPLGPPPPPFMLPQRFCRPRFGRNF